MEQKEDQILLNHLQDLADTCETYGYCTFSDFLNLNEQTVFYENKALFYGYLYTLEGGYADSERKMIRFYPEYIPDAPFPISVVKIAPASEKFSEVLTHRDFLGAVLNLGIDRSKTGDILIDQHNGYLFCCQSIADYICSHLERIRHTKVSASLCEQLPQRILEPQYKTKQGSITSIRIDSILALAFNLSRSSAAKYISQKLVFINGRRVLSNSSIPNDGDIISVRGLGRFKLELTSQKSKKDKYIIKTHLYV